MIKKIHNKLFIDLLICQIVIGTQIRNNKKHYLIQVLSRQRANKLKTFLSW